MVCMIPFPFSLKSPRQYLCVFHPFQATGRGEKSLGKTGKHLPSEKKIAKPLFCRYITPAFLSKTIYQRAGVRVVEWARLESVCTGNSTEGSNPSLSAINFLPQYIIMNILRFSYVGGWGRNGEIETRYWTSHLRFAMLCKSTILQWFLPHRLTATKKFYHFLKWAGGKRWLTHSHKNIFPPSDSYNKYIEPFLGSGSIFFI